MRKEEDDVDVDVEAAGGPVLSVSLSVTCCQEEEEPSFRVREWGRSVISSDTVDTHRLDRHHPIDPYNRDES